jgi:sigma-B regulation protein RsbU (phosphoserine phosphatase)
MTRDLAALTHGAEQLAMGNLNARVPVRSRDEIGKLAESFNRMARDLGEHQTRLVEQERLRKELEMSRRIQAELLPKQPLQEGPVEVKGISIPAQEVGGDFFNYFPLPGGDVAILVGDVSGKGVAAALLMANLQATLQARLALAPDLDRLAAQLDEELEASTPREVYLTLFMAILNHRQGRLRYVNAGHIPQLALRSSGEIERLESTGRPLGLLSGGGYVQREVRLGAGDALFLYTDGLVEARDASGNEFGQERVEALLRQGRSTGISQILVRIEEEVRRHRGQTEAADDTAMLVLKFGEQTHDAARA